jgi:hypothetical protein
MVSFGGKFGPFLAFCTFLARDIKTQNCISFVSLGYMSGVPIWSSGKGPTLVLGVRISMETSDRDWPPRL